MTKMSKTKKYLWKGKIVWVYRTPSDCDEEYSKVRKLTVNEAISWYKDSLKYYEHFNCYAFTCFPGGLFYKKNGKWVLYEGNN